MKMTDHLFPIHEWKLEETTLERGKLTLAETLFSLANGYIGTRATFEESLVDNPSSLEGTYLNGVYAREPIYYDEVAHAFATHNNKLVQAPDAKAIRITIDGTPFAPSSAEATSHVRTLDFRHGVVERRTCWKLDDKRQVEITSKRLVSLGSKHIMAFTYAITPKGFSGAFALDSLLGTGHLVTHAKDEKDPRAGHISAAEILMEIDAGMDGQVMQMLHEVKGSGFVISSMATHSCSHGQGEALPRQDARDSLTMRFSASLKDGETLTLTKFVAYDHKRGEDDGDIKSSLKQTLTSAASNGFAALEQTQQEKLATFWEAGNVVIAGDAALQQGIRFNLLHIFMSSGKDGQSAIAAKGLSGPGYDGHYFWDTEIYIIPFFVYTNPEVARKLLEYRYSILPAARTRANQMSHKKGALFAWRTIGGEECSSFFPAGTAQYHINGAIAYAIMQYYNATQDMEFMAATGLELLMDMARIWMEIGHFSPQKNGAFCIHEVTGPDEYTAMVDNNFYTNTIARAHLRAAVEMYELISKQAPDAAKRIADTIQLDAGEVTTWQKAAEMMYLPYDAKLGIHAQDDTFLSKPRWDFENVPESNYPLLLHYHPLVIYRHQVLKQADVVLAMALLGHQFETSIRRANLDYYEPITTHDSTLSTCMYSIESARAGKHQEAYALFENNVRMDIDNLHHNTQYGLHTACMAGSWMSIVLGFAGMEVYDNALHFAPHLPQKWEQFAFNIRFRGSLLFVTVDAKGTHYRLEGTDSMKLYHYGEVISLQKGQETMIAFSAAKEKKYA